MNRCLLAMLLLLGAAGAARAQPPASVQALIDQSRATFRSDPERSRSLAEQALAALALRPDADLQIAAHSLLCDYHVDRDRRAAHQHLQAGRALLSPASRPALGAQLLGCEGELSELAGETAQALVLYQQAVAAAKAAQDDEVLANALFQRGYLRGVRGELSQGLSDLRGALDIYERLQLPQQASNTLNAVATLYNRMGDQAQSRLHSEQALRAQQAAGLLREQAVTQHNLGRVLENLGDWPAARSSFEAVLALSGQIGYPRGEAYALRGLASVSNAEGDGAAALALLARAAALLDKAPDQRLRAQIELQRGIALRLVRRPGEGLPALKEALKIFETAQSQAEVAAAHGELAATHAALGEHKLAYEHSLEFKRVSDRLLKRQIDERFAALKVEFDTAVTDKENQLLKREKAATEHALVQERHASALRAVALLLASLLVAVLAVLVLRHRRASRRMHGLAMTDELTLLANRRQLLGNLKAMIAAGKPCGLLIADLDLFKAINDRHGHLVGDEVLRAVATTMRGVVPASAQLGRLGGEEFIVLLPGSTLHDSMAVAEKTRQAIAALDTSAWLPDRGITISIGVTVCGPKDELSAALRRADEALYAAKREGRNCVRASGMAPARAEDADARPQAIAWATPDTVQ
ncbi:MAG TPA: tetratricopeptide repeat-containing diguanylate cyclase [Albitalea sp.]